MSTAINAIIAVLKIIKAEETHNTEPKNQPYRSRNLHTDKHTHKLYTAFKLAAEVYSGIRTKIISEFDTAPMISTRIVGAIREKFSIRTPGKKPLSVLKN